MQFIVSAYHNINEEHENDYIESQQDKHADKPHFSGWPFIHSIIIHLK